MAWPSAGRGLHEGRLGGCELPRGRVEAVGEDLVNAQVGGEGEAVVRADDDAVRIWPLLAARIHS